MSSTKAENSVSDLLVRYWNFLVLGGIVFLGIMAATHTVFWAIPAAVFLIVATIGALMRRQRIRG